MLWTILILLILMVINDITFDAGVSHKFMELHKMISALDYKIDQINKRIE